ncbi:hypothetical protein ACNKHP_16265 [Shigella boydii]
MWHLRYPLADGAKPLKERLFSGCDYPSETMLGDTGVAVNPEDPRYKDLIGKEIILPIVNRRIQLLATNTLTWKKVLAA